MDAFVQDTFTPSGEMVYEMIKERLDIPKEAVQAPVIASSATSSSTITTSGYANPSAEAQKVIEVKLPEVLTTPEQVNAFINQAVYQKVIMQKTTWYKFTDPSGAILKMQIKQLRDTILNNPELVNHLRSKMQK